MPESTPDPEQPLIQVSLLTGFLGSGKTTLLNRLLHHPLLSDTAVIINEFGEIGLDHQLVEHVDENTVLLNSGCLCCTVQGDLVKALSDLYLKRMRAEIPPFRRILIETTGLADPAPIIHTLMTAPIISSRYMLDGIITTVDAVNGEEQLDSHTESVKQAAVADRIVLTKSDLLQDGEPGTLEQRLTALNPGAPLIRAISGNIDPDLLFNAGLYDPETKSIDVKRWLREEAYQPHRHDHHGHDHQGHDHDVNRHDAAISAFCLTRDTPLNWDAFVAWIRFLIGEHGHKLLRIKGIVNIAGRDRPLAIHGVQHLFHDPVELPNWPDDDRRSRIVFITRDLSDSLITETLDRLQKQADEVFG